MKAELPTTLIPIPVWDRALKPIERSGMVPSRREDRASGGMRFLGYGESMDSPSYGPAGRSARVPQGGTLVDLYV